jgi:type IV secretory pathway VirB10-like protein
VADGIPPPVDGQDEPPSPSQPEPPPLDSIRVRGQGAKGVNKPAILGAAGGGVAIVLLMASGAFSGDPARKPAETKPMMSDPARPEMAKGTIRDLPVDYTQVATAQPAPDPVLHPQLGPPLPGDIAAFAQPDSGLGSYSRTEADDWGSSDTYPPAPAVDPLEAEMKEAERSGLFFAIRDQTAPGAALLPSAPTPHPPSTGLTAFAPETPDEPAIEAGAERVLFPGAVIPASLVTEVNSESPGPVIAQVTQAVYDSATGQTLLIPQGARLIGDYRSSTRYGQSRVAIVWSRLIMLDGREIALAEAALDPAGAAGVGGEVDNHWAELFGAAALGTMINVGVATAEDPIAYGGNGIVLRDPVDDALSDGVQSMASNVTNRVVDRSLAIPPTIRVPAGAKLTVIVTRRSAF